MSRLPSLIAATALSGALLFTPAPAQAGPVTHTVQTIDIPCGASMLHQPSDWFIPAGAPKALVWLQHGFARTNVNVADLATHFAEAGYLVFTPALPFVSLTGCTLQNLTGNRNFLDNVAALFGTAADPTSALGANLARASESAGHASISTPSQMIFLGHSAGAEAVTYVANRIRTAHPGAWPALRGLILLDPVKSFVDNNTDPSLIALDSTGLPIRAISAAPSWCNDFGSGTAAMQRYLHRPFLGVRITHGSHVDAEGTTSDPLGTLLCGVPQAASVAALDTLALGWSGDYLSGATGADPYPGTAFGGVAAVPGAEILRPY
jgi:hypothetical protein